MKVVRTYCDPLSLIGRLGLVGSLLGRALALGRFLGRTLLTLVGGLRRGPLGSLGLGRAPSWLGNLCAARLVSVSTV